MIPKLLTKGKMWLDIVLIPVIILLVAIGAFGLGRLSSFQEETPALVIHQPGEVASSTLSN